jgi:hypothetical protein
MPPLLFAGAEDKNCCSFRLNKLDTLTQTEKAVPRPTLSEGNAVKNIYIDAGDDGIYNVYGYLICHSASSSPASIYIFLTALPSESVGLGTAFSVCVRVSSLFNLKQFPLKL